MKMNLKLQSICLIIGFFLIACNHKDKSQLDSQNDIETKLTKSGGPYLGQKRPGMEAKLFAPGVISNGLPVRHIAVMPDGKEVYFSIVNGRIPLITICYTKLIDGEWTKPEVAPFAKNRDYFYQEHHITPDGKRMMFSSSRPIIGETPKPGFSIENIWVMDREENGWGEPYDIGSQINTQMKEFQPSTTHDGTLYFTRFARGDKQIFIYRSHLVNGNYTEPEKLPSEVNAGDVNCNAYIAPDESYIVFYQSNGDDPTQYHVSFRNENDEWSKAVKLDERINVPNDFIRTISISSDGKYLFFLSRLPADIDKLFSGPTKYQDILNTLNNPSNGNSYIYWVDAKIIEELKPEHLK